MKTFHVTDVEGATYVVSGEKFSITDEGHLVISSGENPNALFAARMWKAVREMPAS
jgi:hypothetical protein